MRRLHSDLEAYLWDEFGHAARSGRRACGSRISWGAVLAGGLALAVLSSHPAMAQCSATGVLSPGSTVTCSGADTARVGQGPGADNVTVNVRDGGSLSVFNTNAISLGNNAVVTLGSSGPGAGGSASNPAVMVRTTTDSGASGGQYGDGSNTIDLGSNSSLLINRNASVISTGTQTISEAINLYGPGNTITNYGLIQGGPSSAIFFQNVNTTAASPRNVVDNYGTIQLLPVGSVNPVTGGQAVSSYNDVGIDFINESGAKVIGNLVFQGGDDRVTLNPGSSVSGDFDGGAGNNLLTLNASGSSADTLTGELKNFQTLNKTGSGSWTLTGAIGNNTGSSPLAVNVIGGTLALTGNNSLFNGSIAINPGSSAAVAGPDTAATLEARAQSLPPLITDHGVLLLNQVSPDGIQPADGTYAGVIRGTGGLVKIGSGATVLNGASPYTGSTTVTSGALAIGDAAHGSATLSGGGALHVASGASLGGYGAVAGSVTNDGTVAVANALPLFSGGSTGVFTVGGALQNNAVLNAAGSSIGNTLVVRGAYTGSGASLQLNTLLNGGGPLSSQVTDRLLINGAASGHTTVRINGSGAGASTGALSPSDGISVIQVAGSSSVAAFTLAGGYVSNGTPYQYHLIAYGPGSPNGLATASQSLVGNASGHWDYRLQSVYVTPTGPATPPVVPPATTTATPPSAPPPAATTAGASAAATPDGRPELAPQVPAYITMPTALFNAGFQDLDSLHRRLGEVRDDQQLNRGQAGETFARGLGGRFTYVTDRTFNGYGFDSSQDYAAIQFGANRTVKDNASGTLRAGVAVTIGKLSFQPSAVDGVSQGQFNTETLAALATWQSRAGWYVDAIVSGGGFDGRISTPARGQTTGMNGSSVAASIEAGYPIPLGWRGVTIEPQVQVVYQHLDFTRRTDIDGADVNAGDPAQGVLRGGARLTKQFIGGNGAVFTPYLKANLLQGIGGGDPVRVGDLPFDTGRFGTALQVGGGTTGTLNRSLSVYGDVAWQQNVGGGGSRGWTFNGGLRLAF